MSGNSEDNLVRATSFEEFALFDSLGFEYDHAEMGERRVVTFFKDPQSRAAEVLRRHNAVGVSINSRSFVAGLAMAKRIIFSTRDAG